MVSCCYALNGWKKNHVYVKKKQVFHQFECDYTQIKAEGHLSLPLFQKDTISNFTMFGSNVLYKFLN